MGAKKAGKGGGRIMRQFVPITSDDISKISLLLQKKLIGCACIKTDSKYIYVRFNNIKVQDRYKKPSKH